MFFAYSPCHRRSRKSLLYLAAVRYMYFLLRDFFHVIQQYHEHVNYYYLSLAKKA